MGLYDSDIPSDWIAVSAPIQHAGLVDPTECVEKPIPGTHGNVVFVSGDSAIVRFNGCEFSATRIGKVVSAGDSVSIIVMDGKSWCISNDGNYPSAWPKNLWLWIGDYPASLFLRFIMRKNPPRYRFQQVQVLAITGVNGDTALVRFSNGLESEVPIMFGNTVSTSKVGDGMVYHRPGDAIELIGMGEIGMGEIGVCAIGSITASDFWLTPGQVYSQLLIPVDFTPITWTRNSASPLVQLTIDNTGLLTFLGLNRARDIWCDGLFITPQVGFSGQVQNSDDLDHVLSWEIVSVSPGVLANAATPPSISSTGVLSMAF